MNKSLLLFCLLPIILLAGNNQTQHKLNHVNKNFFIQNKGQWPSEVKYLARVGGMNAWITNSGVVYDYFQISRNLNPSEPMKMDRVKKDEFERKNTSVRGHVVKMSLVDIDKECVQQGNNKQEGYYNYFIGNEKSKWASYVGLYGDVAQSEIYKNIDVKYYFDGNSIRYDYIVKPGADLSQLRMEFEGQESVRVNDKGELIIKTSLGEVTNGKLYSYQTNNGVQNEVSCRFVQGEDGTICLNAVGYDKAKELIIDPLVYSTFIGGNIGDYGNSIAVDGDGNTYLTGETASDNYPTTLGSYQYKNGYGGGQLDVFVTKLNPTGSSLVYSTFVGGYDSEFGKSIAIDAGGNTYLTGYTGSLNYPTTPGAFQTTFGSGVEAFVTKLNSTGSELIYSTFLGVDGVNYGYSIAVDTVRNAYITGWTSSSNYPITPDAYQSSNLAGDIFVTKLNFLGSGLIYSTFIGGNDHEEGNSVAIDAVGNAYITGYTGSSDYPTTPGAFQTTFAAGSYHAFITKLNSTGSKLVYSTFLGGGGNDNGKSIVIDSKGNAFITGSTTSSDYPTTQGAFQISINGGGDYYGDVFVTKLNPSGSGLVYSTFIGGMGREEGNSIAIDPEGNAIITGYTGSMNYPTTSGAYQTSIMGIDVFVSKLNSTGSYLVYSTFIGGNSEDEGFSIAIDKSGNAYLLGNTYALNNPNYPVTPGAYQTTMRGDYDIFVTKLNFLVTGLQTVKALPLNFELFQNYPNPFNPSTEIKYSIKFESEVSIKFYNSLGQCVREVNEGTKQKGNYEFKFNSEGLASGVYFYSIRALSKDGRNDFSAVKKMMLIK